MSLYTVGYIYRFFDELKTLSRNPFRLIGHWCKVSSLVVFSLCLVVSFSLSLRSIIHYTVPCCVTTMCALITSQTDAKRRKKAYRVRVSGLFFYHFDGQNVNDSIPRRSSDLHCSLSARYFYDSTCARERGRVRFTATMMAFSARIPKVRQM